MRRTREVDQAAVERVETEHVLGELGDTMIRSSSEGPPGYTFLDVFTPDPQKFGDRLLALARRLEHGMDMLETRVRTE